MYKKFGFDMEKKQFIGRFDEMYQAEERDGYDSWYQEDMTSVVKQISLVILGRYNFANIIDLGCGKGTFTHFVKRLNNRVVAIDLSETAIQKAQTKYPDIDFRVAEVEEISKLKESFDLAMAMDLLSYVENWQQIVKQLSGVAEYLYITLWLPDNPIGFVKSFDELRAAITQHWDIETELMMNSKHVFIFARSKTAGTRIEAAQLKKGVTD